MSAEQAQQIIELLSSIKLGLFLMSVMISSLLFAIWIKE